MLASHMDAEGAARAQGLVEFQESREIWIGEVESIQVILAQLRVKLNMQDVALKNLELDVGSIQEEIRRLDQVDDADRALAM